MEIKTWHIHISGQVQGVGFRPFISRLATEHDLKGWVNNSVDGVHIEFNASRDKAKSFFREVIDLAPELSRITSHRLDETTSKSFDSFQIIHSSSDQTADLLISPDFALCEDCRSELDGSGNRRNGYAFTTCTNCGPRYSIIHSLPYDRATTSMDSFQMCQICQKEYEDPLNRRYYSQTNSCPDCQVELYLLSAKGKLKTDKSKRIIKKVASYWEEGKIIAIKGIGGYLLTCDANNEKAIETLRELKHRPSKPFAIMYPDFQAMEDALLIDDAEKKSLLSYQSPIVLLEVNKQGYLPIAKNDIAPGLNHIGVMLPSTPLYDLILKKFGKPIVATSGNISNSPIVFENDKALKEFSGLADYIVSNNREIFIPQDDSVIKFSSIYKKQIVLRRSRGMAPTFVNSAMDWPDRSIFCAGAMLKSSFAFLNQKNIYLSQYLGDLDSYDTLNNYKVTAKHFFKLLRAKPEKIIVDKHPQYPSTIWGCKLSKKYNVPIVKIQHHMAHFGAVLGENNLVDSEQAILGVIFDGTGLGDDGQIWGGEFFLYQGHRFSRIHHFGYFDHILGDKMPKEPRISALSSSYHLRSLRKRLKEKFDKNEWKYYLKILKKGNSLKTSSVGRLFDAVASLLDIQDVQTYEGEAAIKLEVLAMSHVRKYGLDFKHSYYPGRIHDRSISTQPLIRAISRDLIRGNPKEFIAAKFHFTIAFIIKAIATKENVQHIAFSGGVFQNSLLVDYIIHHLGSEFELYFHKELSPNDENIAFGQLVCSLLVESRESRVESPDYSAC